MNRVLFCVAALLILPTAALAQGDPGPFGGLFGRTPERIGRDFRLFDIRLSSSVEHESALLDSVLPREDRIDSGFIGRFTFGGMYAQQSTRLTLNLYSSGVYQQYLQAPYVGATSGTAGASMHFRPATRVAFDGTLNYLYSPYFQFHRQLLTLSPTGIIMPPASPYVATLLDSHTYDASGGVTSYYSKRSNLSASFSRRETHFTGIPEARFELTGARGAWNRQLNRDLRLRLGYSRDRVRQARQPDALLVHEVIDVGVDFEKPLSLTRRTTLAFSTETSMLKKPDQGRHYRLNGRVMLSSMLRRTWQVGLAATRLTELLPGFTEPLFSDNLGVTLSGLMTRRTELALTAAGGRGHFGIDPAGLDGDRFTIANTTAQLTVAVSRHLGIFGQYSFNYFQMPPAASTVAPIDRLGRQAVIVGLNAWVPVYMQERGPRDSR